jgi:hypothetical protein
MKWVIINHQMACCHLAVRFHYEFSTTQLFELFVVEGLTSSHTLQCFASRVLHRGILRSKHLTLIHEDASPNRHKKDSTHVFGGFLAENSLGRFVNPQPFKFHRLAQTVLDCVRAQSGLPAQCTCMHDTPLPAHPPVHGALARSFPPW